MAGLWCGDAAGLVWPVGDGVERSASASECCCRIARRASLAPHGPWRDGNADARFHIGMEADPAGRRLHEARNSGRVFGYWEQGALLDGLVRCRKPPVSGLKEGPFTMELHDDRARHRRYNKSKLALTPLGYAILAQTDDFTRHNPIRRWCRGIAYDLSSSIALFCKRDSEDDSRIMEVVG